MYYVYLLRCAPDALYTGVTTDVPRRMQQHLGLRAGGAKYTARHRPLALCMVWSAPDQGAALRLEAKIKRLRPQEKRQLARTGVLPAALCPAADAALYAPDRDALRAGQEIIKALTSI